MRLICSLPEALQRTCCDRTGRLPSLPCWPGQAHKFGARQCVLHCVCAAAMATQIGESGGRA